MAKKPESSTTDAGEGRLEEKELDAITGGVASFSELQGITTKVDVIEHDAESPSPTGARRRSRRTT